MSAVLRSNQKNGYANRAHKVKSIKMLRQYIEKIINESNSVFGDYFNAEEFHELFDNMPYEKNTEAEQEFIVSLHEYVVLHKEESLHAWVKKYFKGPQTFTSTKLLNLLTNYDHYYRGLTLSPKAVGEFLSKNTKYFRPSCRNIFTDNQADNWLIFTGNFDYQPQGEVDSWSAHLSSVLKFSKQYNVQITGEANEVPVIFWHKRENDPKVFFNVDLVSRIAQELWERGKMGIDSGNTLFNPWGSEKESLLIGKDSVLCVGIMIYKPVFFDDLQWKQVRKQILVGMRQSRRGPGEIKQFVKNIEKFK